MPSRRCRIWLGATVLTLSSASLAAEREAPRISLRVPGDSTCSDEADLVGRVERRLLPRSVVDPREHFEVELESSGDVTSARLVVTRTDGSTAMRVIQGSTCDDVYESIAFIVAMTIDPETAAQPPQERPTPTPLSTSEQPAPATAPPPLSLGSPEGFHEPPKANGPRGDGPSPGHVEPRDRADIGLELGALFEGTTAIAPGLTPVARLFVAVRWPTRGINPSLRASFARSPETRVPVDENRGGLLTYTSGRAEGCVTTPLGAARFFVDGCAAADLGALKGEGYGVEPHHEATRAWFALDALGRFGFLPTARLALQAETGLIVPVTRYEYELHGPDKLVFRAPPVAVSLGAGLAVRLE